MTEKQLPLLAVPPDPPRIRIRQREREIAWRELPRELRRHPPRKVETIRDARGRL